MNFRQLENYHSIIVLINRYEVFLRQADTGLSARRLDTVRTQTSADPHRLDQTVIHKEETLVKYRKLKALAAQQRPEVEKTIKAAVTSSKKDSIRLGLILRMRYLSGHGWNEIAKITGITKKKAECMIINSLGE